MSFHKLRVILTTRGVSHKLKGKFYRMCVQRVIVYGSETWPMRVEELRRLERAERMMIRWMCGATLKDRCRSEELRKRLDIEDVADVVRKSRLGWFGHLERKMRETGYQLAEIWLSQEMLERVDQGRGVGMLWKTI